MSFPADYYERDLNPPDADGPTPEVCRYCERPYFESESDATERGLFCDSECEDEARAERYADRDEAYERAAAKAAHNNFEDTNGKDWR